MLARRPIPEVLDELTALRTAIRRAVVDYTSDVAVDHLRREACHAIERLGLAVAGVASRREVSP